MSITYNYSKESCPGGACPICKCEEYEAHHRAKKIAEDTYSGVEDYTCTGCGVVFSDPDLWGAQ